MTVAATDYVDVETAKFDLRIDGTEADAALARLIPEAVSLAGAMTGRDLLAVDTAADIVPGLQALVVAVLGVRYDGLAEMPASVYAMAAPFRMLVSPADDD